MQELRFSDSYDNQSNILSLLEKSISKSIKPKFISSLSKTLTTSLTQLQLPKTTQSQPILKDSFTNKLIQRQTHKSSILPQTENTTTQKIKQSIELIKKTTIHDDKPINVYQLFRKAQFLSDINHQNKRTVKFIQICQRKEPCLMIQKNSWRQFSLFDGKGILALPDGRKIKAKWYAAQPVGNCQITYPNQSIYYGPVNQSYQKHGHGYIYFSTGQKIEGEFTQGKISQTPTYYNKNGQIIKSNGFKKGLVLESWNKMA